MNFTSSSLRGRIFSFPCWVFCSFCKLLVDCSEMTQGGPLVSMKALNVCGNEVSHRYFCYFSSQWSTPRQHRSLWLVALAEVLVCNSILPPLKGNEEFCSKSSAISCMSLKNGFIFLTFWTFLNLQTGWRLSSVPCQAWQHGGDGQAEGTGGFNPVRSETESWEWLWGGKVLGEGKIKMSVEKLSYRFTRIG